VNTNNNAPAVNLTAVVAKTDLEAAKVYPGNYWMQMLEPPARSAFPIGQGAPQQSLEAWVHNFKSSCNFCHQLGNPITRTLDHVFKAKPELKTSYEAWDYRITTGVRGSGMSGAANQLGRDIALKMFSSWTDRIKAGETPEGKARTSYRHRTQCRHHPVGLGHGSLLHARPGLDQQEQADTERWRQSLGGLGRPRNIGDARSEDERDERNRNPDPHGTFANRLSIPSTESAVVVVG
jgi:hypothetical protein